MICGVVLAAGEGRRFAAAAAAGTDVSGPDAVKQLTPLGGRPLIEHALEAMAGAPLDARIVVLGAHAERVAAEADLHGHEVVTAADWHEGLAASLRAGVAAAAARGADAVVVTLADEPGIGAAAIARVVQAWDGECDGARAAYGGVPGHPVLLAASLFGPVAGLRGDQGAREILRTAAVRSVPCDDAGTPGDIDVPADLERIT